MADTDEKWYFCMVHRAVEPQAGCKPADRLGPYDSADKASRALEIAAERTKAWDNDPLWNDLPDDSEG
jgi:hypothetical protein